MDINTNNLLNLLLSLKNIQKQSLDTISSTKQSKTNLNTTLNISEFKAILNNLIVKFLTKKETADDIAKVLVANKNMFVNGNISSNIKSLVAFVQDNIQDEQIVKLANILQKSLIDLDMLNSDNLKQHIKNSGVLLESKLKVLATPFETNIENIKQIVDYILASSNQLLDKQPNNQNQIPNTTKTTFLENIFLQLFSQKNIKLSYDMLKIFFQDINTFLKEPKTQELQQLKQTIANINQQITQLNQPNLAQEDIKNIVKQLSKSFEIFQKQTSLLSSEIINKHTTQVMQDISLDLKANILKLDKSLQQQDIKIPQDIKDHIDKIIMQIDYSQILSLSSSSFYTNLLFDQSDIDDANINFYKNQDNFTSIINLELKQYGKVKIFLMIDKQKNLNINIEVQSSQLKQKIQNTLQHLRKNINHLQLNLQSLYLSTLIDNQAIQTEYGNNQEINFGIDIKV